MTYNVKSHAVDDLPMASWCYPPLTFKGELIIRDSVSKGPQPDFRSPGKG
ncbi:hypothetical protein [Pectobacterium fontis]|nr:hypothetical protein [Pectobacterium fontis]